MNDDQLHRLLRRHPAQIRLSEPFYRSVLARVEAAKSSRSPVAGFRRLGRAFFIWLSRPLPALLIIALFLALVWALSCWFSGGPAHR